MTVYGEDTVRSKELPRRSLEAHGGSVFLVDEIGNINAFPDCSDVVWYPNSVGEIVQYLKDWGCRREFEEAVDRATDEMDGVS